LKESWGRYFPKRPSLCDQPLTLSVGQLNHNYSMIIPRCPKLILLLQNRSVRSKDQSWSFFSDVWSYVQFNADDVMDLLDFVSVVVETVFTNWTVVSESLALNCEGSCEAASSEFNIGEYGSCSNCYGFAELTADIDVLISDYTLESLAVVMDGQLLANVSADFNFSLPQEWFASCLEGIFQSPVLTVSTVVPLFFQITVPMQIGANANLRETGVFAGYSRFRRCSIWV
jgi:hypothetical protein